MGVHFGEFLPKDKIVDLSKLKTFVDKNQNVVKIMIFVFDREVDIGVK